MTDLDLDFLIPYPITALASSSSSSSSSSASLVLASGPSIIVHRSSSTTVLPPPPASTVHAPSDHPAALIRHIAISTDSRSIASISDDKSLVIHSLSDTGSYELSSSRRITKKPSDICFTPDNSIVISDKVGDVYLYPLQPNPEPETRPQHLALQSDPTLNPDATYLLGHVSVITASILSFDGQHIITADRDEHIRISQFPKSHIIDRYLFGSDGFISALHIPHDRPDTLVSAGGEQYMRIWNWQTGALESKVDIWDAVLPHRRVRSPMRRLRKNKKKVGEISELEETSFYHSPEGWVLPGGQGVCVKKISTVKVGEETMVVFFSEGTAAIHFFALDNPIIQTHPLDFPIIDFTSLPSSPSQLLITLDPTWGILKQNPTPGQQVSALAPPSLTAECRSKMENPLLVLEITPSGWVTHGDHPIITSLLPNLDKAPAKTVAALQLYPLLPLLPRWAGMEEDDDLAGPSSLTPASTVSGIIPSKTKNKPTTTEMTEESERAQEEEIKKSYTREELSQMGNKMLGRLKAQGVDVDEFLKRKSRGGKAAKRRRLRGKGKDGGEAEGEGEEVDDILEAEEGVQAEGNELAEDREEVDMEKMNTA